MSGRRGQSAPAGLRLLQKEGDVMFNICATCNCEQRFCHCGQKYFIPPSHITVIDPPSIPLHTAQTCDQHGPTVTVTWVSGGEDACPLCESYENEQRLRAALEDIAERDCSYGDGCPDFAGTRHGQCIACKAREALKNETQKAQKEIA